MWIEVSSVQKNSDKPKPDLEEHELNPAKKNPRSEHKANRGKASKEKTSTADKPASQPFSAVSQHSPPHLQPSLSPLPSPSTIRHSRPIEPKSGGARLPNATRTRSGSSLWLIPYSYRTVPKSTVPVPMPRPVTIPLRTCASSNSFSHGPW